MGANYYKVEQTLVKAVEDLSLGLPTAYPSRDLKNKPDSLWLNLVNIRGLSTPVTLGEQGEDNHPGIFQIDINYPENKGSKAVLELSDTIASAFVAGKELLYLGQRVKILFSSVSAGRNVGGFYRVSVEVRYFARTVRA